MLKKIKPVLWCASLIVLLHGCKPEEFNTKGVKIDEFNPEYCVPLISSDLTLYDLVKDGNTFVKRYSDGFMSLVYRGQIFSSTAGEAITIPDQSFSQIITLNASQANALSNGQAQTISLQGIQSFSLGGREIDSIWLKAGNLVAFINSQIKTGGSLKITFEDAKNLGTVLSVDVPFSYSGSTPVTATNTVALAGNKWNMSNGVPAYNIVNIKYDLTLNPTTQTVAAGDQMNIDMGFQSMKFSRFYGYIGVVNLMNRGDTINLSLFDNATTGTFYIEDPKVKIICGNSFGVPVKAGFTKLAGYTSGTGGFQADISPIVDPIPVNVPTAAQIGQMLYDSVIIDKLTSNIKTVINQKPKQLIFKIYVDLNPNGKQQRNFITDQSQINFLIEVELPLYGSASNFVMEREQAVDMKIPNVQFIDNILFRFTGVNGYPIDLVTQAYLIDASGVAFDSIFDSPTYKFIEAASVGVDGKVTTSTKKTTDIIFDGKRAKNLNKLKKIKLRAEVATISNGGTYPSVKLYSDYVLGIKIGFKAKFIINNELLDSLGKKGK